MKLYSICCLIIVILYSHTIKCDSEDKIFVQNVSTYLTNAIKVFCSKTKVNSVVISKLHSEFLGDDLFSNVIRGSKCPVVLHKEFGNHAHIFDRDLTIIFITSFDNLVTNYK